MAAQPEAEVKYFLLFHYDPGCSEAEIDASNRPCVPECYRETGGNGPHQSTCLLLKSKASLCLILRDDLLE